MPRVSMKDQLETAERKNTEMLESLEKAETARARAEGRADDLIEILEAKDAADKGSVGVALDMRGRGDTQPARTDDDLSEPEMIRDPYSSQNPHTFLSHPPGRRLGWINPKYRDGHRSWRGWEVVTYTDEIGQNLSEYLMDPPRRFEHADDNTVRRGDSVLCSLDARYWELRQQERVDKANRYAREHAKDVQVEPYKTKKLPNLNAVSGRSMMSS